jgi:hypothetical protein
MVPDPRSGFGVPPSCQGRRGCFSLQAAIAGRDRRSMTRPDWSRLPRAAEWQAGHRPPRSRSLIGRIASSMPLPHGPTMPPAEYRQTATEYDGDPVAARHGRPEGARGARGGSIVAAWGRDLRAADCAYRSQALSAISRWKDVNPRCYFVYLERSIDVGTQWAVFEPTRTAAVDERTYGRGCRTSCQRVLLSAFLGDKHVRSDWVECDRATMDAEPHRQRPLGMPRHVAVV